MYAAWKDGASVAQLAAEFGLGFNRVKVILADEGHKIEVSPDPIYCRIRNSLAETRERA